MEEQEEILVDKTRVLTIFVSSTFKDMHAERDCIASYIAPELNAKLQHYGVILRFIDLRWGIVTSTKEDDKAKESRILSVCFDEIKRSKPLFIAILGNRYGWIPEASRHKNINPEVTLFFPPYDISVTEMEIRFGALHDNEVNSHAIFCIRSEDDNPQEPNPLYIEQDTVAKQRLKALLKNIKDNVDSDRYIEYHPIWKNGEISDTGDFRKLLSDAIWRETCEILHLESTQTQPMVYSPDNDLKTRSIYHTSSFFGRKKELTYLLDKIHNKKSIIIHGPQGCGKSALLCKIKEQTEATPGIMPVFYDVTCTADTKSPTVMLNHLCRECAKKLGLSYQTQELSTSVDCFMGIYLVNEKSVINLEEKLSELCHLLLDKGIKPLFLIDNLDQLHTNRYCNNLFFLPPNTLCIATFNSEDSPIPSPASGYELNDLDQGDAEGLLKKHFDFHRKELHSSVMKAVIKKAKQSNGRCNALWLTSLSHYLVNFNHEDFEAMLNMHSSDEEGRIEAYCLKLVDEVPADIYGLMQFIINKAERVFNKDIIDKGLQLLCFGRQGFRDPDFEEYLKGQWDHLRFAEFCRWMHPFISESDFSHQWMIMQPYLAAYWRNRIDNDNQQLIHKSIATMLKSYPRSDSLFRQESFYHAFMATDWSLCAELIANCGKYNSLPIITQFINIDNQMLKQIVASIVSAAEASVRPETIGKLFQMIISSWSVDNPIESAKLCLQCIGYVDIENLCEDYDFTCLSETLKDRILYAKKAKAWTEVERLCLLLLTISERWNTLSKGKGTTGTFVSHSALFDCYAAQNRMDEAMKHITL